MSAVAGAAYRAGETITNEYDGVIHDYTRKSGIIHTEIMLPKNAPLEYSNRAVLWNAVEKSERYKTAQLAREIEFALPVEVTHEQNISLVRRFVNDTFVNAGMCADVSVHDTGKGNPHAHIMLTMRPIEKDGRWGQKSHTVNGRKINTVDWHDRDKAEEWRKAFADYCNAELRANGFEIEIDHRSYEKQGLEKIPTVHLGVAAMQMERSGIRTERGGMNREIEITNREIRMLRARIIKLDKWIAEETKNTKPPALYDVIMDILNRQGKNSLLHASQMLVYLQNNKIKDLAGLVQVVESMSDNIRAMGKKLNTLERREKTLDKHLMHSDNFKNFRKIKARYENLYSEYGAAKKEKGIFAKRKAKKALEATNEYHETHHSELFQFDAAEEYLRDVLQKRFDPKKLPPITMWQNERAAVIAEKKALYQEYHALKEETKKVEQIKRSVENILHSDAPERMPTQARGVAL